MAATLRPLRDPGVCGRRLPLAALLLLLTLPFLAQAQFEYSLENGAVWITGYTGPGGAVTIPDTIDGLPVIAIGWLAFSENTSLTSITIPSGVTSIEQSAFYGCTSLLAIDVDAENASYASLDGVLFSRDRTTLIQCPGGKVENYTVPEGVTRINEGAFNGCVHLTTITAEAGNTAYSSRDGVLFDLNHTNLVRCPGGRTGNFTIPDGVTTIAYGSFGGCAGLTSVTAPPTLASIGPSAFAGCSNLTAIYFQGDAPGIRRVSSADYATIYYLPGTTGWGAFFDNRPTVLWDPRIQTDDDSFGVQSDQFGFNITATSDLTVVVEASTSLTDPDWAPVVTNTLAGGTSYFSDPEWTSHPTRFYRLRSP